MGGPVEGVIIVSLCIETRPSGTRLTMTIDKVVIVIDIP